MECCLYPCRNSKLGRWKTTPCHKTRNATCTPAFFPVCATVFAFYSFFSLELHTERILYYRNLGLYYGMASTPLPPYSKPRVGVADGCPSCGKPWALGKNPPQSIKRKISHRCLDHAKLTILITVNRDQNRKFRPSGVRVGQNKTPGPQFQNHSRIKCTALPYFAYI